MNQGEAQPRPCGVGRLLQVLMVAWTAACLAYAVRTAWQNGGNIFSWWGIRIGVESWFYGIVPLGILFLVFGRRAPPPERARPRNADGHAAPRTRIKALLAHRRTRERRNTIWLWVVLVLAAVGIAFAFPEAARRASESPDPQGSVFETQRDEWKALSDAWQAQQRAASTASETGNYWTSRDDDAYRVLHRAMGHLEDLRRAEARNEPTDWVLDMLAGDRREWDALVTKVPPEMPSKRRR